ncbi:MAG TPA: hypothetical protein PKY96_16000, partial [Flavobacteriales bacterium]|nr:hypothetical protein [Flavobacteriales bacterium]
MTIAKVTFPLAAIAMIACTSSPDSELRNGNGTPDGGGSEQQSNFTEGKDYMVLERVRFMDTQGFEQPAEAFSILLPKGWKHQGGVVW